MSCRQASNKLLEGITLFLEVMDAIEDSLPSCATRFKQFCWITGTKPGVENRLHADHEMAKLDKAETLTARSRNANRHLQLFPCWKPEALRSLVTSDPQSKTRSGAEPPGFMAKTGGFSPRRHAFT